MTRVLRPALAEAQRRLLRTLGALAALVLLMPPGALAQAERSSGALDRASHLLGPPALPTLPSRDWPTQRTRQPAPPPLLERLTKDPLHAAYHVGLIETAIRNALDATDGPATLTLIAAQLGGHDLWRSTVHLDARAAPLAHDGAAFDHAPLRGELARLLIAIAQADRLRQQAFARLPASLTRTSLLRQAALGPLTPLDATDYRQLLGEVDHAAQAAGFFDLVTASRRFQHFLRTAPPLPPLRWQAETALGRILIDTTGGDDLHDVRDVLLLVDTGGNDEYRFAPLADNQPMQLIFDARGNDRYLATTHASGPAAAVLGYALLWDSEGDDRYDSAGHSFSQAAALFGNALLIDENGNDHYHARSHAQGWALGGSALLIDRQGQDQHHALAHAQGSAGPVGVALLIDADGDDRYTLAPLPLLFPSSQLPERNLSMGQGAAMGVRSSASDGRSLPGGLGALIDLSGDDHYEAEVFAQGAGYFQAAGLLIDGGDNDRFEAAWYAQGAAAHGAAGVLLARGSDNDHYQANQSTALGAGHDFSVALFLDEGGNDHYALGTLGFGAAHDNGHAVFVDAGGDDHYHLDADECRAFGAAPMSSWGDTREIMLSQGLFFDLSGIDQYPAACPRAGNDHAWAWPRQHLGLQLPSERGAGLDGDYDNPLFTAPLTR
ncbi:hypothetical protein [Thauera propionica]|uniref:hypothetical protein n=1 Tax=Thauera propionica TaxID=2019431 RepID=UPI0023F1B4EC|nr:hypothetical protein [Thauera propionica]MDD3677075.1 hypothetical protein [Thauera propionica]